MCLGEPHGYKELLSMGKTSKRSPSPLCSETFLCPLLSSEEVITHPAQIQTGISKHDDVPGRGLLAAEISFQEVSFIIFFCLDNVGAMQVPEENNPGHTALEMKKNEHYIRKMGQNTQKYIRVQWRCWK